MITFTNQNNFGALWKKKHTKILLVDDEPDILEIDTTFLWRYQIVTAVNGKDAIVKAKRTPDLIIMDVMMPEMDGMEYENIRKILNWVMFWLRSSARSEDYSQVAGFDAGADDYITKPINKLVSKAKKRYYDA
jgi:two-component system alkaline phosphatase synthesis response regulator PhoP